MNPGNDQIRYYGLQSVFSGNHDSSQMIHYRKALDNHQYAILVKQIEKEISKFVQKQELIAKSKILKKSYLAVTSRWRDERLRVTRNERNYKTKT